MLRRDHACTPLYARGRRPIAVVPVACFAAALLLAGCGAPDAPPPETPSEAPSAPADMTPYVMPAVTVVTPEELLAVFEEHRGKTVVANFWATWCPPCVEEMPDFVAFHREIADAGEVVLVSVSADMLDEVESALKPFMTKLRIPFPVHVIDAANPDDLIEELGIGKTQWDGTLPATFVFDPAGALQKHWFGIVKLDDLRAAVRP